MKNTVHTAIVVLIMIGLFFAGRATVGMHVDDVSQGTHTYIPCRPFGDIKVRPGFKYRELTVYFPKTASSSELYLKVDCY